ncbi:E3 ubiquitin-protein ligase SP1-like [Vicia villosa]|uniref:E3 ubiquitin-protein ligase SP1-like n=1 Tax=Vicia villosa TaxID=3911 RepID=UPI00273C9C27|nr:E3 ubiquitin-protein ligase SP1-like [Vicia villosa]
MAFFVGGISCLTALALSMKAIELERDAEFLKSAPRVKQLRDLRQLLDAEKSPLVVAVSGRVVSKTPIECQMSRLSGVIVEERLEELNLHKKVATEQEMKSNDDDDSWTLRTKMISSIPKEVPWFLDDETDRVRVVGARGATGFELPAENTTLETLGNRMREKTIGFKRIEWVLPVGTSLNVVGEASKDDAGTIWIQRPPKGPFYVSCKTIDEHATDLAKSSSWRMATSACMTGFGAWCLFSLL